MSGHNDPAGVAPLSPLAGLSSPLAGLRTEPSAHQLRLFLVLAQELHFGRAAARLFMTQPALSRQIRTLEDRLSVRLVRRSSRAVELTEAGRALIPEARSVVESLGRLRDAADEQARRLSGRLTIGFSGAAPALPRPRAVLRALHRRFPELGVHLRALNFVELPHAPLTGEADAVFSYAPAPPGVQDQRLTTERRVVCLPAGDPLAAYERLTLDRLAGRPVIDLPSDHPRAPHGSWSGDPSPQGAAIRQGPAVTTVEELLLTVAEAHAIAFAPASLRRLYPWPGVCYRDVTDLPDCHLALGWSAGERDRPAIAALRAAARTVS
ncbi:LysR substrate-binding domain-containing protein [Streptomyces sp. NPDC003077]|uniref:LysR family transcriptional regulator n=1 Tax=Streptomyces sp. NPDC003077 TaxID=3154443 RepID=UPI0033AB1DFC